MSDNAADTATAPKEEGETVDAVDEHSEDEAADTERIKSVEVKTTEKIDRQKVRARAFCVFVFFFWLIVRVAFFFSRFFWADSADAFSLTLCENRFARF